MNTPDLKTQVKELDRELDEAQRMIDHARKTRFGRAPIIRSALDRRQHVLDVQRIRVKAAKEYLENQK